MSLTRIGSRSDYAGLRQRNRDAHSPAELWKSPSHRRFGTLTRANGAERTGGPKDSSSRLPRLLGRLLRSLRLGRGAADASAQRLHEATLPARGRSFGVIGLPLRF